MQYDKKSIADVPVAGKRVLVRCDFNVPQDADMNITDDKRIRESLPTIRHLVENNARVILCSHLGRPKGQFNDKYSLKPVAKRLSELLNMPVAMASDVIGEDAVAKADALKEGEVLLLENVRFHAEEEKNDAEFAKKLASLAELYVNDAFGTAHRAHASTAGVADYLPAVCGFLIKKEIDIMGRALSDPKRPFVAILGGSKVSDKIGVINNLLEKVDALMIGGGMAYTFVKAMGGSIGKSLCEDDKLEYAKEMIEKAKKNNVKLLLPIDTVAADAFSADANTQIVKTSQIPTIGWGLILPMKPLTSLLPN
jgi:phosphoglycerate kinase